jgi:predicted NBD/HSP70 family sugar kinase
LGNVTREQPRASIGASASLWDGVGSAFVLDGSIIEHGLDVPSTRAIQGRYRLITGQEKTVGDICFHAVEDPVARMVMQEFGAGLGHVFGKICMPYRPQAIVLGGAISQSSDLFLIAAAEALRESPQILRPPQLLDEAALIGAAVRCSEALLSNA